MNTKTKLRTLHAINFEGIERLRQLRPTQEAFIDAVIALEDAMDNGNPAVVLDSEGHQHFFDNRDFDRTHVCK